MKCPSCLQTDWVYKFPSRDRLYGIPGSFTVVSCKNCNALRLDPIPSQTILARYYPKTYYSYQFSSKPGFFWRLRSYLIRTQNSGNPLHQLLRGLFPVPGIPAYQPNGKIMDIGCGSGETLSQLALVGWKTYGIEIDGGAVRVAKKRGLLNVKKRPYQKLKEYPDNYFDVIRLYMVIEHLDDPRLVLALAHRKLKKGGTIIVGTGNTESVASNVFGRFWCHLDSPRHLFVFSISNLTALVTASKFTVIRTYCSSAGGIVSSIQYVLAQYFGFPYKIVYNPLIIALFYPLERILDWCTLGDTFVLEAKK